MFEHDEYTRLLLLSVPSFSGHTVPPDHAVILRCWTGANYECVF